jgi:hypothetical protein
MKILRWLSCLIGNHDWTSAAQQGIPPTDKQVADGVAGFWDYATMYCSHCKHVYKPETRR